MQFRMGFMGVWAAVALVFFATTAFAVPVVFNVSATQQTDGSGLVDVYYDLANGGTNITVEMAISSDGGATWAITPVSVSGDIGAGVTNGTDKHILWDGMADSPDVCWQDVRFRVTATNDTPNEITILLPGDVPLVLVRIPAGTFMMGRYAGEQDSESYEDPQHSVTLSQDFYMGKYEVTQQQWLALMSSWPGTVPSSTYGVGNNYPAYFVSWNDAKNFIVALNTHITNTAQGPAILRLPSEAEWEYACRAGTTTRFYWGDDSGYTQIGSYAWYYDNSTPDGTKPVGGKLANAFGLYDMIGNLWEWIEDDYHSSYAGAPSDGSEWVDSPRGSYRMLRGGGWGASANACRAAFRWYFSTPPDGRNSSYGFRLAAVVPEPEITVNLPGGVPLVLVNVPAGTFQMGRYAGEQDSESYEDPQHSVTISQGFYMGKYEVTQQQWLAVMGSWPETAPSSEYGVGNTYPAYFVSWDDAKNFITALNTHITNTSQGPATVRLPSEAEWEYACRAGTTTRFYFGDSLGCPSTDCTDCAAGVLTGNRSDYMWYCGNNSPSGSKPVGGKLVNAFGLYDMSGNLWEWCEDDGHDNYTGAPVNGSAWVDAPRGSYRVLRGSDWNLSAHNCRSARRHENIPAGRHYAYGFRLSATQTIEENVSLSVMIDTEKPTITRLSTTPVTVQCGVTYTDAGAMATDVCDGNLTSSIVPTNPVDTNVPGTYTVRYNVADSAGYAATEVTRTVNVVDTTAPVITRLGTTPVTVQCGSTYTDAGATATDSCGGNLTGSIVTTNPVNTNVSGTYTVRYNVSDAAMNAAMEKTRTVNVVDSTVPVITRLGTTPVTVQCGSTYTDAGATATDTCGGNLTASIIVGGDLVNTAVPGVYTITYNVSDTASNAAIEVTRIVTVLDNCVEGEGEPVEGEGEPVEGEGEPVEGEGEPVEGEGEPVEGEGEPVEGEGEPVEGEGEPVEGEGEPVEGEGEPVEGEGEPCDTDTEDPVISQCATNQTVAADVDGDTSVPEFADVVATDNCTLAGALTRTQSPEADTQVEVGEHEITITIADAAGNTADCTTTLTVTPWPWRFGDATLDGSINLADVTEALRLATGGTPAPGKEDSLVTADVDRSGTVTRSDMLAIFAFVQSGGIVTEVPKNLIAQSGVNEIILLWGPVPHDNVRGYIVERRIEGESARTRLPETEDPVYYDQEIASARYEYRVAVIDMLGNVETFSDSVTVLGNTLILWAPWAQGLAGDTVVAPIGIGSTRGLNPSDVSITATYDTSIAEYQDVLTTVLSKNLQFIVDTSVPGAITIFATAPQGQLPIGEGRFFDLQMKLKEDAPDGCQETLITSAVIGNASGGGINTESQPGAICVGNVRWGDLDDDGVVTVEDAQLVLDIITRNETFTNELLFKCDMNGDRRIDAADAVLILRLARGLSINPEQDNKALTEKEFSSRLVSLPDAVEVPKDCQFLLPVTVDNASEMAGMDLVISYTRADLRCDAVCATPATNGYELNTELGTGYVRISLGDATSLPAGETVLAYMIFTAIGEETVENVRPPARVRINYAELKGELGESFRWYGDITRQNAEVTILAEGDCDEVPDCDELSGNEGEDGFGSLQVYLGPADAVTAGAQWRRVGTGTWFNNEQIETNIPLDAYQVEFKDINCWTAPEAMEVLIQAGAAPATAVGTYAPAECEEGEGEPNEGEIEGEVEGEAEISASIVCSVIDDETDDYITNATVTTFPSTVIVTENDNGVYMFPAIGPGTYTVNVDADGYYSSSQVVTVADGETRELTFRLAVIIGEEGEGEPMSLEDIANALLDQFDNADTDGDGRLSYDEAHAVVPEMTEGQFDDLDANPDGKLSQRELRALLCHNHCGCCCNSTNLKEDIRRYIGDWLLVGLSLLVLVSLANKSRHS